MLPYNQRIATLLECYQGGDAAEEIIDLKEQMTYSVGGVDPLEQAQLKALTDVSLTFHQPSEYFKTHRTKYVDLFFKPHRQLQLDDVTTVTKEGDFLTELHNSEPQELIKKLKQYLVNKKVYEAFDHMKSNMQSIEKSQQFFAHLTDILRKTLGNSDDVCSRATGFA